MTKDRTTSGQDGFEPRPRGILSKLLNRDRENIGGWEVDVLSKEPDGSAMLTLNTERALEALKLPWKVQDPRTGVVFILCAPGECVLGSSTEEYGHQEDESIVHCTIRKPFYLGETAVTQEQWEAIMGSNPSVHVSPGLPVDNVSAGECLEFAHRCGGGSRFPHEAEWEYACRAGSGSAFSHADDIDTDHVNFNGRHPYRGGAPGVDRRCSVPVKSMPPNRWGFHEMLGNVWEWCAAATNRVTRIGDRRIETVLRGGSWGNHAHSCRCASRLARRPEYRRQNVGFRLAHDVPGWDPRVLRVG